jgi:hypothetical protein
LLCSRRRGRPPAWSSISPTDLIRPEALISFIRYSTKAWLFLFGLLEDVRNDPDAWAACISGALEEDIYVGKIRNAGFEDVRVISKRGYAGLAFSAEVEAHKPLSQTPS